MRLRLILGIALALGLGLGLGGLACSGDDDGGGPDPDAEPTEPDLRRELIEMMDEDQAERTGEGSGSVATDNRRAERLAEIIDEFGWPTFEMVGKEGATAAWVIAQHDDSDVEFQEQALELMREAVEDDQADATELAYLEDRVAVNNEQPQSYGTQVRCSPDGEPEPATPIEDEDAVDERRAEAGMDPLEDYLAEFAKGCAAGPDL